MPAAIASRKLSSAIPRLAPYLALDLVDPGRGAVARLFGRCIHLLLGAAIDLGDLGLADAGGQQAFAIALHRVTAQPFAHLGVRPVLGGVRARVTAAAVG